MELLSSICRHPLPWNSCSVFVETVTVLIQKVIDDEFHKMYVQKSPCARFRFQNLLKSEKVP